MTHESCAAFTAAAAARATAARFAAMLAAEAVCDERVESQRERDSARAALTAPRACFVGLDEAA